MTKIFKDIIDGKISSHMVAENDDCFAFLDINPLVKGHTLAISKKSDLDNIFNLSDTHYTSLMLFAKKVACAMHKVIECKRIGIAIAGFEVDYAHIHLLPISASVEMNFSREPLHFKNEEMNALSKKINLAYMC